MMTNSKSICSSNTRSVSNVTMASTTTSKLSVSFAPTVCCRPLLSRNEYTDSERNATWYTPTELKQQQDKGVVSHRRQHRLHRRFHSSTSHKNIEKEKIPVLLPQQECLPFRTFQYDASPIHQSIATSSTTRNSFPGGCVLNHRKSSYTTVPSPKINNDSPTIRNKFRLGGSSIVKLFTLKNYFIPNQ